jgi:hypothetical protein
MKAKPSGKTSLHYNVLIVESLTLEIAFERHPTHLQASECSREIIVNPDDSREVETAAKAIRNLREFGLLKDRDDEIVELTPLGLRVCALLAR